MNEKLNEKKITLTEEQASRAAETLINAWLRSDDNNTYTMKNNNEK
jgi:hypothetical protein